MASWLRILRHAATASPRRRAWSAFGVLGLMVAGHAVLETARDTLFLSELPPRRLPLLYLAVAAVTVLLSHLRSERLRVGSRKGVLAPSLAGASAVTLGFWALVGQGGTGALYALYLWSALFVSLVVVQFWLLVDEHFTITQARRAYGFIAAGSLVGAATGALLARAAVALLEPRALLGLSAALIALAALAASLILPARATAGRGAQEGAVPPPGGEPLRSVLHQPYFRHLGLLLALAAVVGTVVDFLFKSTVVASLPTRSLGAAFATAALLQSVLGLAAQLLLTGWLLRRVGVTRALLVLPLCLALGTVGLAVGGGLVAAFALKSIDAALRQSLQRTGVELLYLPVEDGLRRRVKPVLDVFGQRLGQALAGAGLLVADAAGATPRALALAVLGLVGVWLGITRLIHTGYLDLFRSALRRGRVRLSERMPDL
ncbi:MAG TPA: MFS transporter, partial [Aggregicoccus sp.]|nr:MFS transporter [Aggregicoccus sp.]